MGGYPGILFVVPLPRHLSLISEVTWLMYQSSAHHYHCNWFFFFYFVKSYWSGWCWCRPSPARWPIPASCPSGTTTAPAPARPPARTVRSSCSKCHGMPSLEAFFCLFVLLANMERSLSLGHVPPCSPQAIFKDPFRRGNNILVSFHFYHAFMHKWHEPHVSVCTVHWSNSDQFIFVGKKLSCFIK